MDMWSWLEHLTPEWLFQILWQPYEVDLGSSFDEGWIELFCLIPIYLLRLLLSNPALLLFLLSTLFSLGLLVFRGMVRVALEVSHGPTIRDNEVNDDPMYSVPGAYVDSPQRQIDKDTRLDRQNLKQLRNKNFQDFRSQDIANLFGELDMLKRDVQSAQEKEAEERRLRLRAKQDRDKAKQDLEATTKNFEEQLKKRAFPLPPFPLLQPTVNVANDLRAQIIDLRIDRDNLKRSLADRERTISKLRDEKSRPQGVTKNLRRRQPKLELRPKLEDVDEKYGVTETLNTRLEQCEQPSCNQGSGLERLQTGGAPVPAVEARLVAELAHEREAHERTKNAVDSNRASLTALQNTLQTITAQIAEVKAENRLLADQNWQLGQNDRKQTADIDQLREDIAQFKHGIQKLQADAQLPQGYVQQPREHTSQLEEELASATRQNVQLRADHEFARKELEQRQKKMPKLQKEIKEKDERIKELEKQVTDLGAQIAGQKEEPGAAEAQIKKLDNTIKIHNARIAELTTSQSTDQSLIAKLQGEIEELNAEADTSLKTIETQKAQIAEHDNGMEMLKADANRCIAELNNGMETLKAEATARIESLNDENTALKTAANANLEKPSYDQKAKIRQLQNVETEYRKAVEERDRAQATVNEQNQRIRDGTIQVEGLMRQVAELEKSRGNAGEDAYAAEKRRVQELEAQTAELNKQLAEATKERNAACEKANDQAEARKLVESRMALKDNEIKRAKASTAKFDAARLEAEAARAAAEKNATGLTIEINGLRDQIEILSGGETDGDDVVMQEKARVVQLETELEELKKAPSQASASEKAKDAEIKRLEQQWETRKNDMKRLQDAIRERNAELKELKQRQQMASGNDEARAGELQTQIAQKNELLAAYGQVCAEKDARERDIGELRRAAGEQDQARQNRIDELQAEMGRQNEKLSQFETVYNEKQALELRANQLSTEREDMIAEGQRLLQQVEQLELRKNHLEKLLGGEESELDPTFLADEVKRLNAQVQQLQSMKQGAIQGQEAARLTARVRQLENANDDLETDKAFAEEFAKEREAELVVGKIRVGQLEAQLVALEAKVEGHQKNLEGLRFGNKRAQKESTKYMQQMTEAVERRDKAEAEKAKADEAEASAVEGYQVLTQEIAVRETRIRQLEQMVLEERRRHSAGGGAGSGAGGAMGGSMGGSTGGGVDSSMGGATEGDTGGAMTQ